VRYFIFFRSVIYDPACVGEFITLKQKRNLSFSVYI
jgi:hypothetical protein